ncbi:hypothetical protein ACEPPN_010949 [Leptodophora sp. 'Broadleaf-Isolate-01']
MWAEVAGSLRSTKYPIIIPDMLGNDGTDKPTDPAAYKWGVMTNDVFEIIDAEDYHQVIIIGHDWGSIAASAMYHYHPKRVVGLVNLSVAYQAPSREPFDLEQMNQMTQEVLGYRLCEYWNFFAAEGSSELLVNNLDRLFDLIHGPAENMKHYFTIPGAMREAQQNNVVSYLINGGEEVQLRPYAQDAHFMEDFIRRLRRDGFEGPHSWYKATKENYQHECDKKLPKEIDVVDVPVLYIRGKDDAMGPAETMYAAIQAGSLPHLEQMEIPDSAHWVQYEKPQEVVLRIEEWLSVHLGCLVSF